jgi:hypothetical protein
MNESDFIYWAFVGTIIVVMICNVAIGRLRHRVWQLETELRRKRETIELLDFALRLEREIKRRDADDADWWKTEDA